MDEQELPLRVGQLATAVGHPLPSIRWTPNTGRWVTLLRKGVAGPVLQLNPGVSQWCTALFDLVVAEALQAAAFGMHRHHRILQIGSYFLSAAAGLAGKILWDWPGFFAGILVAAVVTTLISAAYARWLYRRIDARLREILGVEALRDGLEHCRQPMTLVSRLRWLYAGAGVLPEERLRWLNVSAAN